MRTLVLNATYEPLCVVSGKRAINLVFDSKVEIIEEGGPERVFHTTYEDYQIPSVIRLRRYVKVPRNRSIPCNTRTVLARDRHKCAYCGEKATTMDHVDPKKNYGPHLWSNVVASCQRCNNKKGHRSLAEMGWTLLIEPSRPIGAKASIIAFGGTIQDEWKEYLGIAA